MGSTDENSVVVNFDYSFQAETSIHGGSTIFVARTNRPRIYFSNCQFETGDFSRRYVCSLSRYIIIVFSATKDADGDGN